MSQLFIQIQLDYHASPRTTPRYALINESFPSSETPALHKMALIFPSFVLEHDLRFHLYLSHLLESQLESLFFDLRGSLSFNRARIPVFGIFLALTVRVDYALLQLLFAYLKKSIKLPDIESLD